MAETVAVSPGRVTITHSHAAFTVRQTWLAAVDDPVLMVLLEIDTNRPLRLRASFIPEMKPMWPASFGGQSSSFDEKEKAFILGEGLRQHTSVIGSPLFSTHSEQVGHQLPGRRILAEMEVTPEIAEPPYHSDCVRIIARAVPPGAGEHRAIGGAVGRLLPGVRGADAAGAHSGRSFERCRALGHIRHR